jgi:hypothetical protein
MKYEELLFKSTQVRVSYLVSIVSAAVGEVGESEDTAEETVDRVLAAFSLSDKERDALREEALLRSA